MLPIIIFWCAIVFLAYTHAGYPLLIWVWARLRRRRPMALIEEGPLPMVSILVVAYNEAARIEGRLENLLALDYPGDRLEIILASDGSTDDTASKVQRFQRDGFRFIAHDRRSGKTSVLNELIPQARGDIVLLADARQRFAPDALRRLVRHFSDPAVGAVSGELIIVNGKEGSAVGEGVGFYWRYEKFIRRTESLIDSTVGVTGAIYALRRELFEPIPDDTLLDDVLIPMRIVRRGYRVLFEPTALAWDHSAPTAEAEFARKVRTLAGNFQLFARAPWLLNPRADRIWLQAFSHKACRLLSPFCLAAALGANLLLLNEPFYALTLAGQLALYGAAACGHLLRNGGGNYRLLGVPYAFCLLNWAVVVGLLRYINGRQRVTW
ncbi:MAG TPA: glycosyltransferase family 2 protein [Gammaproteobacteria bacterium]|nr:glycosyltransferase family 2 protein [Gammaproteobacteria bacterium]